MPARITDFSRVSRLPHRTLVRSTSLSELTVAYEDKPTVILEGTGGWSDRIREIAYEGKHLEEAGIAELHFAKTPEEAVELALSLATRGHGDSRAAEREFRS